MSERVPTDFSTLTGPKLDKTRITIPCPSPTFTAKSSHIAFYHKMNLSSLPLTFLPKGTIISESKTRDNKAIKQIYTENLTRK